MTIRKNSTRSIEIKARYLLGSSPIRRAEVEAGFSSGAIAESEYTMLIEKINDDLNTAVVLNCESKFVKKCIAISGIFTIFSCSVTLFFDLIKECNIAVNTILKIEFTGTVVQLVYFCLVNTVQIKNKYSECNETNKN